MRTNIKNQTYDSTRRALESRTTVFTPDFSVRGGSSLLDQMTRAYGLAAMQFHSAAAVSLLVSCVDKTPSEIEQAISQFSKLTLVQNSNKADPDAMMFAICAAALMEAARGGRQTGIEKLDGAIDILSERYQADW